MKEGINITTERKETLKKTDINVNNMPKCINSSGRKPPQPGAAAPTACGITLDNLYR